MGLIYCFFFSVDFNRLEPDVRDLMIQLLALEQDIQRVKRTFHDTFCKMIEEIQTGQRKVKCDQEINTSIKE